ncbi:MAG: hypothetical protein HW412_2371 [Bacteroidetes bacterium]|nr:hypothetical protein [Bacteroidota bacterium]
MKTQILYIAKKLSKTLVAVLTMAAGLHAQGSSAQQSLILRVMELNKLGLIGGSLKLTIDKIHPDQFAPIPAVNANTTLVWTSNGENKKITVASKNANPRYALRAAPQEISPGAGKAAPFVSFSDNKNHDFIVGVNRSAGKCVIQYTASADVKQGIGNDTHGITFTITSS